MLAKYRIQRFDLVAGWHTIMAGEFDNQEDAEIAFAKHADSAGMRLVKVEYEYRGRTVLAGGTL